MGKRSTTKGYWRAHGANATNSSSLTGPSPAVLPVTLAIRGVDATLAGAGLLTGKFMPVGAIPLRVEVLGQGTGGTVPLLDVGLELSTPNDVALADGVGVETNSATALGDATAGTLLGTVLTETAEVTVSDGGGTNSTGGTFDLFITYTFDDDGKVND
jgi:hypothetical protein